MGAPRAKLTLLPRRRLLSPSAFFAQPVSQRRPGAMARLGKHQQKMERRYAECSGVFSNFRSMPPKVCCGLSRGGRILATASAGDHAVCEVQDWEEDQMKR